MSGTLSDCLHSQQRAILLNPLILIACQSWLSSQESCRVVLQTVAGHGGRYSPSQGVQGVPTDYHRHTW